ncbi:ABC transporter substrate-binding protein [Petroclostridium xylanilyticum]|jgi:multiple sugar transport system substrate-binding protein|uniref:ABC transporter substrate-binding protein n=1 Tax=Petroclostridium xylanilyticum TaxID=1792311 RepID=UPI0018E2AE21|nr:sugar ABC transporter substrate-binding protein [Petroclostridium xylanilyticum]
MKRVKGLMGIMIACVLLVSMFAGCGSSSKTSSSSAGESNTQAAAGETTKGEVKLEVLTFSQPHEKAIYDKLITKYQAKYSNVKVNFTVTTQADYGMKIKAAFAAKKAPDVFYVAPGDLRAWVDAGRLLGLDEYIAKSKDIDINNIWPQALKRYKYDGKQTGQGTLYALPKDISAFAYAYNKTMFQKEGIPLPDPNKPYTWDEFLQVCQKLTKDTNGDGKFDQWGAGFDPAWSLQPFIWNGGAQFLNEDKTKVMVDTPEFINALQFFADLTVKYKVTPSQLESQALGYYQRWLDGQLGFFACGNWDVGAFNDPKTLKFDYDLLPWPVKDASIPSSTWTGSLGFAVSKVSKHPQEALNLACFLSVDPDGQKELSDAMIQLPNLMDYAKGEYKSKFTKPANIDVFYNYIEKTGQPLPTEYTYNAEWWDEFQLGIVPVLQGKKTAEQYCKEVAPKMQAKLDKAIELSKQNAIKD